jgi:hypothetical protein
MVLVSELSHFGQEMEPKEVGLENALARLGNERDNMTPVEIIQKLFDIQLKSSDKRVKFAASQAAAEVFKASTPEGRDTIRKKVKEILEDTPDVRELSKPNAGLIFFRFDEEVGKFILPNGRFAPGQRIGNQKKLLGISAKEIAQTREKAMQGRAMVKKAADLKAQVPTTPTKPFTDMGPVFKDDESEADLIRRLQEELKRRSGEVDPGFNVPDSILNPMRPVAGLSQAVSIVNDVFEGAQRIVSDVSTSVEEKIDALDATGDLRTSMDLHELGVKTLEEVNQDAEAAKEKMQPTSPIPLILGISAVAIVGLILLTRK